MEDHADSGFRSDALRQETSPATRQPNQPQGKGCVCAGGYSYRWINNVLYYVLFQTGTHPISLGRVTIL